MVDEFRDRLILGVIRRNNMVKFELYSIVTGDFLVYIDDDDKNKKIVDISTIGTSHKSLAFNSSFGKRYPSCEICSMEECIIIKLVSNTNIHGRQWERRKTHKNFCQDEHYKIITRSCTLPETNLYKIPKFNGMSCFEISRILECQHLSLPLWELAKNTEQWFHQTHFANNWWVYTKKKSIHIPFPLGLMGDQDQIFLVPLMYMDQAQIHRLITHLVLNHDIILHKIVKNKERRPWGP